MVAKRRAFTPCPPSPARAAIDPKTEDWILRWLEDLSTLYPDLLDDLPGYAKALCKVGYKTSASLAFMHDGDPVTEVKNALKINIVLAKAIVAEGLALHPHARSSSRSSSRSRTQSPQVSLSVSSTRTQVASFQ